jgi:uncharacterized integral membrane protein (TIGR00698 family)
MTNDATNDSVERTPVIHEDWTAVILGFLVIAVALAGVIVPAPSFGWSDATTLTGKVLSAGNLQKIFIQFVFVAVVAVAGALLLRKPLKNFVVMFLMVYGLTVIAMIVAGSEAMKALNLEAVIFSLAIGLIIGNFFQLPETIRKALSTEMFVKIGLVLLGTGVLFNDILKAGSLGLIQALAVVLSVWYFAWWLCRKLKIDDELSMMISSAVSICGVSAAIATAGAIKGDPKKLSYVISLVLVTAIPMMLLMPYAATFLGLQEEVTGAWLGGTIDTTGAVVASGTLVGETALKYSTIVKFSQNVLLGLAAFAISIYWTYTKKNEGKAGEGSVGLGVLWERFPKFVLGFVVASLIFSFILPKDKVAEVKDSLKSIQTLWFVLAFTSIGLETKFSDLVNTSSRRPLIAFLTAQAFNIVITLVIAWFLFSS